MFTVDGESALEEEKVFQRYSSDKEHKRICQFMTNRLKKRGYMMHVLYEQQDYAVLVLLLDLSRHAFHIVILPEFRQFCHILCLIASV